MRVAALQFDVRRGEIDANLAEVERGLRRAADEGTRLVVLPEMWPTSFVEAPDEHSLEETDVALDRVAELAQELELVVCGSAFGRGVPGERPRNRLHVFDRGELVLSYDKVHLFSPTAEPETFSAGSEPPATVDATLGRLSGAVCYDLRFGPLLSVPFQHGAQILVVPAQWPDTRATHWRALVLGRAVEGQCFVVAANRTGTDLVGRKRKELAFPGNSLVADPDGNALAEGAGRAGLVAADVDLATARKVRVRVPVATDRRTELYGRWNGGDRAPE